jgi:hypothetical protein
LSETIEGEEEKHESELELPEDIHTLYSNDGEI